MKEGSIFSSQDDFETPILRGPSRGSRAQSHKDYDNKRKSKESRNQPAIEIHKPKSDMSSQSEGLVYERPMRMADDFSLKTYVVVDKELEPQFKYQKYYVFPQECADVIEISNSLNLRKLAGSYYSTREELKQAIKMMNKVFNQWRQEKDGELYIIFEQFVVRYAKEPFSFPGRSSTVSFPFVCISQPPPKLLRIFKNGHTLKENTLDESLDLLMFKGKDACIETIIFLGVYTFKHHSSFMIFSKNRFPESEIMSYQIRGDKHDDDKIQVHGLISSQWLDSILKEEDAKEYSCLKLESTDYFEVIPLKPWTEFSYIPARFNRVKVSKS